MLKKLIAYDFRCTWRGSVLLLVTSVIGAIISMLCGLVGSNLNWEAMNETMRDLGESGLILAQSLSTMLSYFAVFGMVIMVAVHYYQKFVSDEAYLTFTLPATQGQHLLSKMISGCVWVIVAGAAAVLNTVVIQLPGIIESIAYYEEEIVEDTVEESVALAEGLSLLGSLCLVGVAFLIAELGLVYLCLTIGGVIANKNKAVAGGVLYWLTNGFVSGAMTVVAYFVSEMLIEPFQLTETWSMSVMFCIWSVVIGGFGVVFFYINRHLLTKKLNLP